MAYEFPERDWKTFRALREAALERLCERVLGQIDSVSTDLGISAHARYRQIYELIHKRDDELARAFDNPRRSTAVLQLVQIVELELVSEDELQAFTSPTRTLVQALAKLRPRNPRGTSG